MSFRRVPRATGLSEPESFASLLAHPSPMSLPTTQELSPFSPEFYSPPFLLAVFSLLFFSFFSFSYLQVDNWCENPRAAHARQRKQ